MRKLTAPSLFVPFALAAALVLSGCGPKPAKVNLFPEYVLTDPTTSAQTKSAVTITVTPLGPSRMYEFPELFSFRKEDVAKEIFGPGSYLQKDYEGQYWWYTFGCGDRNVAVFRVEIQNGTDHILRMKDARIYLEVEGEDPIAAVTKLGNPTLQTMSDPKAPYKVVPTSAVEGDESLVHWVTYFEKEAERLRPKGFLDTNKMPVGLGSQVIAQNRQAYKLVADTGTEILPGKTFKGILLFPVIVSFDTATLSFYDIHTKTDAAGTPTEKQTFTFPAKLDRVQMQWDGKQERRWKKVSG